VRRISTAATQPVILRQRKCARTDDKACQCKLPTPGESPNHPRSRTLAFIEPEAYAPHRTVAAAFGGGSPCRLSGPSPSPRKPAGRGGKPPFAEASSPYLGAAGSRGSKVLVHRNPSLATSPST
jgi:hypothetical protein